MPFTEWPYGGVTPMGVTRTGSADSPLMVAIANTSIGEGLNDAGIQIYGWVDAGGNFSSNTIRKPGGNAPINYAYIPNTIQLDQVVIYLDRFPDTVQTDHIDWGMRLSAIYGENYRYTQSYGLGSWQFNGTNQVNGFDFPMVYGELYIPWVAEGLMIRVGRYISLPDIEAQLAPNNYMYTHSFTYGYDNYTNEGIQATLVVNKNIMLQLGVSAGTEATIWNYNRHANQPGPDSHAARRFDRSEPAIYRQQVQSRPGRDAVGHGLRSCQLERGSRQSLPVHGRASTAALTAITTSSGTGSPTITSSMTNGTSRTSSTTCTRTAYRTSWATTRTLRR